MCFEKGKEKTILQPKISGVKALRNLGGAILTEFGVFTNPGLTFLCISFAVTTQLRHENT